MTSIRASAVPALASVTPLSLVAAADVWFFGSMGLQLGFAGFLIQLAVLAAAWLIMVPRATVRAVCTVLLLIVSLLGAMTVGAFYIPAVCAGAAFTIYQFRVERRTQS